MLYKLWKPHCHFTEVSLKFMKKASVQQLPTKKRLYTKFIKARRHDMTSCWLPTVRFLNTLPSHFSRPKNCDTRFHKVFVRSRNLVSFCLKNFLSVLFVSASKSLISSKFWVCSYRRGSPSKGSESNASIKWKFQHLPGYTPGHLNFCKLIYSNPPPPPSQDGVQMSYSSAGSNSQFSNTRQNRRP